MSAAVTLAVLAAAALHSVWNAIAKAIPDRLVSAALIGLAYLVAGAVGCVVLPPPDPAAWVWLVSSSIVQTGYLVLLTAAYARTDFSRAYPLTRGTAVLGVTVVSAAALGQRITLVQTVGVCAVAGAILSLALVGRPRTGARGGIALALAVGVTITAYSVLDGVGVRAARAPLSYAAWLFLLQGVLIPLTCLALTRDRRAFGRGVRAFAGWGTVGGALSVVAYTIVVWAQSLAPFALVSALRETGVLMAGLLGWLVFHEPFSRWRTVATVIAAAGIIAVQLG